MKKRIRVLIVDDSVVVRRIVKDALSHDPAIEVTGVAANGKIALAMIEQNAPDIVTLDVEMPEMDGLELLRQLRAKRPSLPVIMFSTLTQRGAAATIEALTLGARDYVTKPANVGSVTTSIEAIRSELIPKLKALCSEPEKPLRLPALPHKSLYGTPAARLGMVRPIEVVAMATSTGGPNALAEVLPQLPADLQVAVLVVQHMPPVFTRCLAERLNSESPMAVAEAADNQPLRPGKILIAPGDYHIAVEKRSLGVHLRTLRTAHENFCRPAADVLFRSVARVYGARALGVVMTGMGQDGLRGAQEMHDEGAAILVQNQATSVVWGMPGFVAQAGLAAKILPLPEIATEIVRRIRESHRISRMAESKVYVNHSS